MSRFFSVLCVLAVLLSSCAGKESASTDSGCEAIEFKDLFIDDHWGGSEIVLFSVRLDSLLNEPSSTQSIVEAIAFLQKHGFAFAKIYTHDYYRGYYDSRIHDEPYALTDTIPLTALNNEIKLVRKDEVNILSVALLDEDDFTYWIDNGYCKITKDGDVYDVVIEGDLVKRNKEKGVHIEAMAPSVVVCGRICGSYRGAGHVK